MLKFSWLYCFLSVNSTLMYTSVSLSVSFCLPCLSPSLSTCLSVCCLSLFVSVYIRVAPCLCLSACLLVCTLSVPACPSVCIPIALRLPVCLYTVCLSIFPLLPVSVVDTLLASEFWSCVKVEADVLVSLFLIFRTVSVDVKQYGTNALLGYECCYFQS